MNSSQLPPSLVLIIISAIAYLASGCRGMEPLESPAPVASDTEAARIALGQSLFFDPRLSRDGDVACATCHRPDTAGAEPRAKSVGTGNAEGRRNAPSVLNAALKFRQFWDGRAGSLEEQALEPLYEPSEMATDEATMLAFLNSREGYVAAFARAFPGERGSTESTESTVGAPSAGRIDASQVARSLAAYQRRLAWPGRVDRFLQGDESALTPQERAGYDYFSGNCAFCHDGRGIGGQRYEKLGEEVPWPEERADDLGLMEVTGDGGDRLRFVVPSLRHVADTAPYFHDGSVETLEEAVRLMARHQLGEELTDARVEEVTAFLRAIDGDVPPGLLTAPELY